MYKIIALFFACTVISYASCCSHHAIAVFRSKDDTIKIKGATFKVLEDKSGASAHCSILTKEDEELIKVHHMGDGINSLELFAHIKNDNNFLTLTPVESIKIKKEEEYLLSPQADCIVLSDIANAELLEKSTIVLILEFKSGKKVTVTFKKQCAENEDKKEDVKK